MVRILMLKRLHELSGMQVEFQLLDRLSFQRFCGLKMAANIPDRTTVWNFGNRIGAIGAQVLFDSLNAQLLNAQSSLQPWIEKNDEDLDQTSV